jgi:hypothetical protein
MLPALQDALAASEAGEVKDPAHTAKVKDFLRKLEQPSKIQGGSSFGSHLRASRATRC